ncbi:MAG: porin family protein [bacterium]
MRMNGLKLGLILVALAAIAAPLRAQSLNTFHLGLEAGANFSNLMGKDLNSLGSLNADRLGFVAGGYLELDLGNSFALRPEVLYEQKGAAISGSTTTTELDYIEIPVLLKIGLGSPVFNPSILVGPSFDWNTLAKDGNGNISNVNSSDIGLVAGLQINVSKFLVSGRYELGLDNVAHDTNVQNGTLTFLVGYSFI